MDVDDAQVRETAARAEGSEQNSRGSVVGAEAYTAKGEQTKAEVPLSMEAVITRSNLMLAYQRVVENKGAAGVENLSVGELKGWLKQYWASVRETLLQGNYVPQAIRQVEIPKPDGGVRLLGIPTVVDRLIQQAIKLLPTTPHALLLARVLRLQLWLPTGSQCGACGATSTNLHAKRPTVGGRSGSGKVL